MASTHHSTSASATQRMVRVRTAYTRPSTTPTSMTPSSIAAAAVTTGIAGLMPSIIL
ncbi:hypothetical protein D3C71_1287640 [compost metagenome]